MHHQKLNNDTLLFVGEAYESAATAFINGNELFLVDALASLEDARWMQHVIEDQGLEVTFIATTHYMSDHMAGIGLFPRATTIAHENYRHTFLSQNVRVDGFYTEPHVTFKDRLEFRWGRHLIRLLHNPGKTMDHITVDAPASDIVCAGDNIVGNIVYLSKADPCQIDAAIEKVQQLNRKWVISAHMGLFPASTLGNARYYLAKLRDRVVAIRRQSSDGEVANQTLQVRIEDCLPVDVTPTAFEREWHQNNLRLIRDQGVFDLDAFDSLPACG
jgi:glyoxylase-like metal-dependent hydrolase (beta-lactamase superfamily II)